MALLSSYEIFCIAVNNIKEIRSSYKFPFVCPNFTKFGVLRQILVEGTIVTFHENTSNGSCAETRGKEN